MRKAIEQFQKLLVDFIEQRDKLMLLVACPEAEAALMLKLLLDQQNNSRNDLYYLIADDFTSADEYVDAIVARLEREYNASVETPGANIPPVIDTCRRSSGTSAGSRLVACFSYARSLIPPATGHRIVWCLSPGKIARVSEFEALLLECVSTAKIEPWMRGLRLFTRLPEMHSKNKDLIANRWAKYGRFAIPADASESELRAEVSHPKLSPGDRAQALLQLGFIDLAHGRFRVATAGLKESLAIYQQRQDPGMQSLSMIGLGDVCRREGDLEKAKYWYECAIVPAGEGKQIVCLAMIAQHLGAIAYTQQRFADAAFYYDQLAVLKRSIPDEDGLVEALLWRGRSQAAVPEGEQALASFQEAVLVCKSFDLAHHEEECLVELRRGYAALGRPADGERECSQWRTTESLIES